ncbi:flavodoxin family protein [Microbacterium sp. T2.11-28]|uniref:flavodoxin family protein n=1 Tax=unclassified Microbacterium TaxID=2609290 RepID=UPI002477B776|nr:NAD(P)H-dependent oxidoreductase [Microbacterium sp. T2.11-28]CAI9387028.1 8-demethyl-8-aminoriboflavin-5'-phosphate synthase [Microbacterium sp. T2.11-28]
MTALTALALNCTLKPSPADSSTDLLLSQVMTELGTHDVTGTTVRVVDFDVRPGVETDMGDGDEWPKIRELVLAADIVVIGTPIWMGHMSSIAQRVLERLDAELSETDEQGRPILFDKVAAVAVVGNEDGAHHATAELYQGLVDVGFTVAAQAATYWNGEAMQTVDYRELDETPEAVANATEILARTSAHLARALRAQPYPAAD